MPTKRTGQQGVKILNEVYLLIVLDFVQPIPCTIGMEYEVAETEEFNSWRENLRDLQARHKPELTVFFPATLGIGKPKPGGLENGYKNVSG
jgi:hypothetical protein